ncbi:MAG: FeoB-associated Cys-rich membrane protein [Anaerolineaceae bacterium]|nr:FeoB-associated Cys-rich membrane protein [Anaerolineaceae bacterium]
MNIWDIVIILLITGAVFLAFRSLRSSNKKSCSGYCSACPHRCKVEKEQE